jgi:glutamate carboxypeptidase
MPNLTPRPIFENTLALLEEMIAISSPSSHLAGLEAAARHYGEALKRRGLAIEIRPEPGNGGELQPVLYARGPRVQEHCFFVVGHLDTVLEAVPPERRDDRLWGTGVIDMKGGLAVLAGALDLLAERGQEPPADLLVAVVPDEEVGGHLTHTVVEAQGSHARAFFSLEPGQPQGEAETLVIARRGLLQWHLEVEGKGAHAGNGFWQGRSALEAAAEWCLAARGLAAEGSGPTLNAGRLVAGDAGFVENLGKNAGLVGTNRQINVVPNRALVEGESRYLRQEDGEVLPRELERLAEEIGKRREVSMDFTLRNRIRPLVPGDASHRWARRATELASASGWTLEVEKDRGGISFPNFLSDPGEIPILDGLGPVGGGMHTREEFLDLTSLDRRISLLADLLTAGI